MHDGVGVQAVSPLLDETIQIFETVVQLCSQHPVCLSINQDNSLSIIDRLIIVRNIAPFCLFVWQSTKKKMPEVTAKLETLYQSVRRHRV